MADRLEFKEKLSGILSAAREQGGKIALEDVELYFEEDRLSQEQIDLVCEYLLAQKIAVTGYVPKSGTVKERKEEPASLSNEEQSYIEEYLKDIDQMQGKSLAEARMAYYLPKVVDEALKMHHAEIFVGNIKKRRMKRLSWKRCAPGCRRSWNPRLRPGVRIRRWWRECPNWMRRSRA